MLRICWANEGCVTEPHELRRQRQFEREQTTNVVTKINSIAQLSCPASEPPAIVFVFGRNKNKRI